MHAINSSRRCSRENFKFDWNKLIICQNFFFSFSFMNSRKKPNAARKQSRALICAFWGRRKTKIHKKAQNFVNFVRFKIFASKGLDIWRFYFVPVFVVARTQMKILNFLLTLNSGKIYFALQTGPEKSEQNEKLSAAVYAPLGVH